MPHCFTLKPSTAAFKRCACTHPVTEEEEECSHSAIEEEEEEEEDKEEEEEEEEEGQEEEDDKLWPANGCRSWSAYLPLLFCH